MKRLALYFALGAIMINLAVLWNDLQLSIQFNESMYKYGLISRNARW